MNSTNIVCEYNDFIIFENDGKLYYKESDSEGVKEVELVDRVLLEYDKPVSDSKLLDPGFDFDVSGELFNEPFYCYWKFVN